MAMYIISEERLTEIADMIRSKTGGTEPLSPADMVTAIHSIIAQRDIDGLIERTTTVVESTSATKIGANAFYDYAALTDVIFQSVRVIGNDAFNRCTSLSSVELPSLSILGARVFNNCSSLTTLDFRDSRLTAIPANSFSGSGLTTIWLPSSVFCAAVKNSFSGCPLAPDGTGGTIYLPASYRTAYEANTGWAEVIGSTNNRVISY